MVKNTAWGYLFNFALFFSILLSSVSSEDAQDRSDRVLLTPWVKFLWEAYRNVLELLRNNNRVEKLYQETAKSGKSNLIVLYFPGTMLYLFFCSIREFVFIWSIIIYVLRKPLGYFLAKHFSNHLLGCETFGRAISKCDFHLPLLLANIFFSVEYHASSNN